MILLVQLIELEWFIPHLSHYEKTVIFMGQELSHDSSASWTPNNVSTPSYTRIKMYILLAENLGYKRLSSLECTEVNSMFSSEFYS